MNSFSQEHTENFAAVQCCETNIEVHAGIDSFLWDSSYKLMGVQGTHRQAELRTEVVETGKWPKEWLFFSGNLRQAEQDLLNTHKHELILS
jgi:hypothetical protein